MNDVLANIGGGGGAPASYRTIEVVESSQQGFPISGQVTISVNVTNDELTAFQNGTYRCQIEFKEPQNDGGDTYAIFPFVQQYAEPSGASLCSYIFTSNLFEGEFSLNIYESSGVNVLELDYTMQAASTLPPYDVNDAGKFPIINNQGVVQWETFPTIPSSLPYVELSNLTGTLTAAQLAEVSVSPHPMIYVHQTAGTPAGDYLFQYGGTTSNSIIYIRTSGNWSLQAMYISSATGIYSVYQNDLQSELTTSTVASDTLSSIIGFNNSNALKRQTITPETWTFTLSDNSTVTKTIVTT